jgi:crotonobetainyl-CoA:carnitine CoA-transferase CaiB-like acyl-CoA transferase
MGDCGADVVKIEHPRGDSLRTLGMDEGRRVLWWALIGRNKRAITLTCRSAAGAVKRS